MPVKNAAEKIRVAAAGWKGVTARPHRFGGTEYKLGKREIGHVHGNYLVDIPFPKKIRDEIVGKNEAAPHHILPDSGWVSVYIYKDEDVDKAVNLLLRSYILAAEQMKRRKPV